MSFAHLGVAIWHRWTIICVVPLKISDKPETIDALKDNICEAIAEIQLHTIDNVHKKLDRSCTLQHGQPRQTFEWNYFPLLAGMIVLWNKKEI